MALRATGWRRSPPKSSRLVTTAVPEALRPHLERTRVTALTAPFVLGRVRDACEGSILLVKGPEAAVRYPHGARGYGDLDLLVPGAAAVQRQLRGAGFDEMPDPEGIWAGIYHLPPMRWRGSLYVEVHTEPHWPDELRAPSIDELLEAAVPSQAACEAGVDGILAPAPAHHALLLAAHAWAHQPLGRARDLVDVGAFRAEADAAEIRATARRWGIARLWETTERAIEGSCTGSDPFRSGYGQGTCPSCARRRSSKTTSSASARRSGRTRPEWPRGGSVGRCSARSAPQATRGGARSSTGRSLPSGGRSHRSKSIGAC